MDKIAVTGKNDALIFYSPGHSDSPATNAGEGKRHRRQKLNPFSMEKGMVC